MKRILPILLVIALVLCLLVSCGPKKDEKPDTEQKTTTTVAKKTTTSKKVQMGIDSKDEGWAFWKEF
jgi:hypothetical protein